MAGNEQHKSSWLQRRREAKREKAARTGDSPEKLHEHPEPEQPTRTVEENAKQAGIGGFNAGGF